MSKPVNVWDRLAAHIPNQRDEKAALKVANPYIPPDCAHLMDKEQREAIDQLIRVLVASQF